MAHRNALHDMSPKVITCVLVRGLIADMEYKRLAYGERDERGRQFNRGTILHQDDVSISCCAAKREEIFNKPKRKWLALFNRYNVHAVHFFRHMRVGHDR